MKQSLLQRLIDRRDKLDAAIEVLRDELGEELQARVSRNASKALASGNGSAPVTQYSKYSPEQIAHRQEYQRQYRAKQKAAKSPKAAKANKAFSSGQKRYPTHDSNSPFRGTNREIKQIPVPSGVSFEDIDISKAIGLAVRAVPEPIPTPELRLLLETAGVKFPKTKMPRNRFVGVLAARLAATGEIKRTADGWTANGKGKR